MIAPYLPDTQGVFDLAHLLYGDKIFTAMAGEEAEQGWVLELLEICLDLYLRVTRCIKEMLGEPANTHDPRARDRPRDLLSSGRGEDLRRHCDLALAGDD